MILKGDFKTRKVWIDGIELLPQKSMKVRLHSPDGFFWGYGGSAPSQLALAILLEVTSKNIALSLYQKFKQEIIAPLSQEDFEGIVNVDEWIKNNTSGMYGHE